MSLPSLSLSRPVLAIVMNIVLLLFGIVAYQYLPVREYPAIDPPTVTVRTAYTGAPAEIIENQITEPLEKQINGIPGVRTITSTSSVGTSLITVEFNLGVEMEAAAADVRDKVSQAMRNLPQDLDAPPVVSKADANSDFIILIAIQSPTKGIFELSDYAENSLVPRLQSIDGVSSANIFGQKRYAMRLWIDPIRLEAHQLTFQDVKIALNRENIELPAGKITGTQTELSLHTQGRMESPAEFNQLIVRKDANGTVTIGDIGYAELGTEVEESTWLLNGMPGLGIAIIPQPGANHIEIADEFYKRLKVIQAENKQDIHIELLIDNTQNIRHSIHEVIETLLIAFSLVVLVVFAFFRNWLIAIRPLIDIPISLVASFFVLYLMGYSINVLTLLGIVLATGLVVDDGIVVTENIFRKLESGMNIRDAAREGSDEIFFVVIATSLALAVVFLPVIFLQGFVGSLFREFGVVIACSVLISAFVSLTITPVLNVYLNRNNEQHSWFYLKTEPFFVWLEKSYESILSKALQARWIIGIIIAASFVTIYHLNQTLSEELAPMEDKSSIRLMLTTPEGSGFDYTRKLSNSLSNYLYDSIPERTFVFNATPSFFGTGMNSSFGRLSLVPPNERTRSQNDVAMQINKMFGQYYDAKVFAIQEQTISVGMASRGTLPVQFVVQNFDFKKLREVVPKFLDAAKQNKVFQNVDVNLKFNKPELQIYVDRDKVRESGLQTADVFEALQTGFGGGRAAYFTMNGNQYTVIIQVSMNNRMKPEDLLKINVRSSTGKLVPIASVANWVENSTPPTIFHHDRYKSATFSASLVEGKTIGDGIKAMNQIADSLLDETFQRSLSGPSRDFSESSSNVFFVFILALILTYLLLAAQFESFIDPFVILLTVPLALTGAFVTLWAFDQTINLFSQIGMILLIGLVTKNGIMIVEFANNEFKLGLSREKAALRGAVHRLRPILMTSLATAFGALPLAISLGAAATSRKPLGLVIVGGIALSLILTLFVVPVVYTFTKPKVNRNPS
ncbi:MAG: efflux RND transporter permease subunit [Bacteroidia bacterium]|nr:efflux RND transporter permease subunit [Bacteroidia bacterium]